MRELLVTLGGSGHLAGPLLGEAQFLGRAKGFGGRQLLRLSGGLLVDVNSWHQYEAPKNESPVSPHSAKVGTRKDLAEVSTSSAKRLGPRSRP